MKTETILKGVNVIELSRLRKRGHERCLACIHPELKLHFTLDSPGVLRTSIRFKESMMSFNGMVHGGLQSFLIDEAMTCALLGQGVYAATADLKLRYKHSVRPGVIAFIRVWVSKHYRDLFHLEAEITQAGKLCTTGHARFMRQKLIE